MDDSRELDVVKHFALVAGKPVRPGYLQAADRLCEWRRTNNEDSRNLYDDRDFCLELGI